MVKFQIKRGDKVAGAIPSSKVKQLAAAGKLLKTDLLCKEGTDKWVLAANVKGLWETKAPSPSEGLATDQAKPQPATSSPPASAQQQQAAESPPQQQIAEAAPQQVVETPPQQQAAEPPPQQQVAEAVTQEQAPTGSQEVVEEYSAPDVETFTDPNDEYSEEYSGDVAKAPRRKWLVPLAAGCLGSFLLLGLLSAFMKGEKPAASLQAPKAIQGQQSVTGQQSATSLQLDISPERRSNSNSTSNLSLTQDFFQPNIAQNVEYTTKKYEKNTTVALYEKTTIERWDTESELYYHEKQFRNYGVTVPYKVSNGYVQLKGGEHWFRFLKLDAKVGDRWTPGDGEEGTLDWTGKGIVELVDFKTVDSVPVAIIEFTAKLGHPVSSYLVPAAFDFGFMEDGVGPIEGKLRFELGQGLGILRADAIVPKGMRHKNGGGRDSSDWIFATRRRKSASQSDGAETQAATETN